MADIWIWNSMARRRRSVSDTFEENGIQIIKSYLNSVGHSVNIIDWANTDGYNTLSPLLLRVINKRLFQKLLNEKKVVRKKVLGILFLLFQGLLNWFQKKRIKKKLKRIAKDVKQNRIRLFGIKVWYGEAFTWAKYLTGLIHKYSPETVVIAGGYHATLYEEDILKYSSFDLAVIGEGEYVLKELLDIASQFKEKEWGKLSYLNTLKEVIEIKPLQGLIYRNNGTVEKILRSTCELEIKNGSVIPFYSPTSQKVKVHILIESLGCPWGKCNFCVHNHLAPNYRKRSIPDIIFEIKTLIKQGVGLFRFTGSDTPPQFGKAIAEEILKSGIHIEYTMGSRAIKNSADSKIFDTLVECYKVMILSGLRGVFIGGETGNNVINDTIMNKGITSDDIIYTIRAIREAEKITGEKVTISLALIYPTPVIGNITLDDVKKDNLQLLQQCNPDSAIISPPAPFKNSMWYNARDEFGFEVGESFIQSVIEYEYVLYKPLTMWPDMDIKVQGKSFKEVLAESQNFREMVEKNLGIPTDLSDEHFLMIRKAGLLNAEGIKQFKLHSMTSIVSCDYTYISKIGEKVSEQSRILALKNS
jgi:radical SAM superfamily enzyme YgiQ (UPF0313 family)